MSSLPTCVLYTQDDALARRVTMFLEPVAAVNRVARASRLDVVLAQSGAVVLFIDLLDADSRGLLRRMLKERTRVLVVALGSPGSEPFAEAEGLDVHEVVARDEDRRKLRALFGRAQAQLEVLEENRLLKEVARGAVEAGIEGQGGAAEGMLPGHFRDFSRAFRHFGDVEAMLENVIEGVAGCVRVSRVGVFSAERGSETFRFKAGIRCMEEVRALEVSPGDPLVRWLEINARLISRSTLVHVEDPGERLLLSRELDRLGAEVIVPLHGRKQLLGWLFAGRRVTGAPFSAPDLEGLMGVADHVCNALENALLYEEAAVQRTLAETLLESVNMGIVALGADGKVRWFNRAASELLAVRPEDILDQPAVKLGGRLGDLLTRRVAGDAADEPAEWSDPLTKRSLSVVTKRLTHDSQDLGAVAILKDLTEARRLRTKQHRLERAAFWQDLAAAIAHEVRGPLVAINTYFQLLPERHDDPEFRNHFAKLVPREIARLNQMVEQINAYANPPELTFETLELGSVLAKAVAVAKDRLKGNGVPIEVSVVGPLPCVDGDETALVDSFAHLIVNAVEALGEKKDRRVEVKASSNGLASGDRTVHIDVCDNGQGIPLEISEKLFSPFCTKKPRGIGLGLPIVKRTVTDHNGQVSIETGDTGTCVSVELPASVQER